MASHPIYQFKAELCDYKPLIWRRFQVTDDYSLARLAYVVMTMFEMEANHLFAIEVYPRKNLMRALKKDYPRRNVEDLITYFEVDDIVRYEVPDENRDFPDDEPLDAVRTKLKQVIGRPGDELCVEYDFGEGWKVLLRLEEVIVDKELPGNELPRVLGGAGFGIVEDCGGPGGLKLMARAFARKKGAEYEQYRNWLGVEDLDLAAFDLEDMNFRVRKLPRIYADIYERDLAPTKASEKLIGRKYKEKG